MLAIFELTIGDILCNSLQLGFSMSVSQVFYRDFDIILYIIYTTYIILMFSDKCYNGDNIW